MALKKTITLPGEVEITDAYHRVSLVVIDMNQDVTQLGCTIQVDIYKSKTYYENATPPYPIRTKSFHCRNEGVKTDFDDYFCCTVLNILNKNPISQSYLWLKTLPEYAGAEDV